MKNVLQILATVCALLLLPATAVAGKGITVFAAASLKGALDEVAALYDADVVLSYGGSGQIARQVIQGAPADVVLLANAAWMDWLAGQNAIAAGSRVDLLSNTLVLIAPTGAEPFQTVTVDGLLTQLDGGRLAIGQTVGVPAGIYGRQWLENARLWDDLSPHLAQTENVRAALALVSRAEAPLGLVYQTDALADRRVAIVYDVPGGLHDKITYSVAVTEQGNVAEASEFIGFLQSDQAMQVFRRHGFLPLGGAS